MQTGPPRGGYRRYTVPGPMTRRGAHENMWHDIASYSNFLENLIGDGGPNCDLYRGLFNLSAALHAKNAYLRLHFS